MIDLMPSQRAEVVGALYDNLKDMQVGVPSWLNIELSDGSGVECLAEYFAFVHEQGDGITEEYNIWLSHISVTLREVRFYDNEDYCHELTPWEVVQIQNEFYKSMEGLIWS